MRFKDYMNEEKVHTPTVYNQTNAGRFLDELKSMGVEVINIYKLLQNAKKYEPAFVLGLTGIRNVYSILAKALKLDAWTDSYDKLKVDAIESEKLIKRIVKAHKLIYLMPPAIRIIPTEEEVADGEIDDFLDQHPVGHTEREFWTIWHLCKKGEISPQNVTIALGAHHILPSLPRRDVDPHIYDPEAYKKWQSDRKDSIESLEKWKQNVNRSPMNKNYKGEI